MQGDLFPPQTEHERLGKSSVFHVQSRTILNPGNGFMSAYDYTLNPYSGCTFGCTYCYAAFFTRRPEEKVRWGEWVKVKENAVALLRNQRRNPLNGKTIYMSSVTDPYQPADKKLELTRSLLKELATFHKPHLVIQTRSPLVVRDLDILKQIGTVQVNMTVTTDNEEVRSAFEPTCPSNKVRLKAIREVQEAGVQACITMTPLLPVEHAPSFARDLLETGVRRFIVQPFHARKGRFVAGTRVEALRITEAFKWDAARYEEVVAVLKGKLPNLTEGKEGFAPPQF